MNRQLAASAALFESLLSGIGGLFRRFLAMGQAGCSICQNFLGLVDFRSLHRFQTGNFGQINIREQAHEFADIPVIGISPELPVIIGTEPIGVEPDRTIHRFAHFRAVRFRNERGRHAKKFRAINPAAEFDAVDNIPPLVGAAHLQSAAMLTRQFEIIIGLQDHIIEFEERERLLPLQPQFDRIKGQHPVDRKMAPDFL